MRRAFDVLVALAALVFTAPLMALIALLVKVDSRGPVFFRQERVGRGGQLFTMLKFRKMRCDLKSQGAAVTSRYDSRFTAMGRWLERAKLDELPQLFNVLKGDMSLVGPRPELKKFTKHYPEKWRKVLSVRPGLIGIAQIHNRNESEMYPPDCRDRERFYVEHILPAKLDLDAAYIEHASLGGDLRILALGLWRTLTGTVTRDSLTTARRSVSLLGLYTLISLLATVLATYFVFWLVSPGAPLPPADFRAFRVSLMLLVVISPVVFVVERLHRRLFGIITLQDVSSIFRSCVLISLAVVVALQLLDIRSISRLVYGIGFTLRFVMLVGAAYLEMMIVQKNKLLRTRAIRKEVFFEALMVGLLSLLAVMAAHWMLFSREDLLRELRETRGVFLSVLVLNPLIYLATFREAPARLLYFLNMKARQAVVVAALGTVLMVMISIFLADVRTYSRESLLLSTALNILVLMGFFFVMWLVRWRRMPVVPRIRVLLIGLTPELDLFIDGLRRSHTNYSIAGILSNAIHDRFYTVSKIEVLGALNDLEDVLSAYHVDVFVVSPDEIGARELHWIRRVAERHGVRIRMLPGVDRFMRGGEPASGSVDQA